MALLVTLGLPLLAACTTGPARGPLDTPRATLDVPPEASRPEIRVPEGPPPTPLETGETALFNGVDLSGWREMEAYRSGDVSAVAVVDGCLVLEAGSPQTGITWAGDFPQNNYEVRLEASRLSGSDFFCGMTFPVGDAYCTLIVGGWGGMVVGLSNVDGLSAVENLTTLGMQFDMNRWYGIRLRVDDDGIGVWIDGEEVIDLQRAGHGFEIWPEQHAARPFGINTWFTTAALRDIRLRQVE